MKQSIDNKLGEINFRKKLVEQQTENKNYFEDEFDSKEIEKIMIERMKSTYKKMNSLLEKGIPISPYLEIGAERGQRSLVMENDLNARGAALDLSFDTLKSCTYYSLKFNKSKIPLRLCTDAYSLPFKSGSFSFVFCYQTLHHFPDPTPIISEIHRVLSDGGSFFFDEEPFKKVLHIDLYKKRNKIYSDSEQNKNLFKKILDFFFAEEICNETDYGIVENHEIDLKVWKNGLKIFSKKNVQLNSARILNSNLFSPANYITFLIAYLLGGNISGICKKSGEIKNNNYDISELIVCPVCMEKNTEITLTKSSDGYSCKNCNRNYPVVEGVLIILKDDLFSKLYPEYNI